MSDNQKTHEHTNSAMHGHDAAEQTKAAIGAAQKNIQDMLNNTQSMFGLDPAKATETFRAMTQKSVEQSKEAYARLKTAADDATKTLESTMEHAHQGTVTLSKKAIDALRTNAEVGFSHLEKLMAAKSFSDVIELQSGYVRQQIEMATDQAKDMQALSQSIAQELMKPGREAMKKATDKGRTF